VVQQPFAGPVSGLDAKCQVCDATPAIPVRFLGHQGMVLLYRQIRYRGTFCRDCGRSLFRTVMNRTLLVGWWGIISVFLNVYTIIVNLVEWNRLRGLAEPMRTSGKVPLEPGRPLVFRPGAWVTSAVVVVIIGGVAADSARNDINTFSAADRRLIGTCVQNVGSTDVRAADCLGAHSGKIVSLRHDKEGCTTEQVSISLDDGAYACADPKQ
jgi:hypothetical protein